jgi:hypothetical protein
VGPRAASGPLNGARSATTSEELEPLEPVLALVLLLVLELELQAARPAAARLATASPAAARRVVRRLGPVVRCDLRMLRMVMVFIPSAVRVVPAAVRPG